MGRLHNKLQSDIFLHVWNNYPEFRYMFFAVNNNLTTESANAKGQMGMLRSMGVTAGVLDLLFYHKGHLYGFDIKIGNDKLKPKQCAFISKLRENGGDGWEVRSFEDFIKIFHNLISVTP